MAITNYDGIINARANGGADDVLFCKTAAVGGVSGQWYSYLRTAGQPAAITVASSAGQIMTSTDVGAIPLQTVSTATQQKYLLTVGGAVSNANMSALAVCDVLYAAANITTTTTAAQTINSSALTRSDGKGVEMVVCVSSVLGATGSNFVINYTDSDNSTRSVTIALTTAAAANRCMPAGCFYVARNGTAAGVKSVQTVNVATTMGAAGTLDLYLVRPLAIIPTIGANTWVERDTTAQIDGLVEIATETGGIPACLGVFGLTSGTGTATLTGMLRTCKG